MAQLQELQVTPNYREMPKSHDIWRCRHTSSHCQPALVLKLTGTEDDLDAEDLWQSLPLHFWHVYLMLPKTSAPGLRVGMAFLC